jgi:hypothetical protein
VGVAVAVHPHLPPHPLHPHQRPLHQPLRTTRRQQTPRQLSGATTVGVVADVAGDVAVAAVEAVAANKEPDPRHNSMRRRGGCVPLTPPRTSPPWR